MAITDALGTACKMIGVAADIYRGLIAKGASDSKYARWEYQSQPPAVNNGQDAMKQAALKGLSERVKALGVSNTEVTNIIHRQYNKASSKEMSVNEVADLANNLEKFVKMGMGA
jgi:hypothetical protein